MYPILSHPRPPEPGLRAELFDPVCDEPLLGSERPMSDQRFAGTGKFAQEHRRRRVQKNHITKSTAPSLGRRARVGRTPSRKRTLSARDPPFTALSSPSTSTSRDFRSGLAYSPHAKPGLCRGYPELSYGVYLLFAFYQSSVYLATSQKPWG